MEGVAAVPARHLLITGPPGVGKTSLVRRALQQLQHVASSGFITEEVRGGDGRRSGFDVLTLSGERAPLARAAPAEGARRRPRVGQYTVDVAAFESAALPTLKAAAASRLLVLDEVGKMELLSAQFQRALPAVFDSACTVVATVPLARPGCPPAVQRLTRRPDVTLLELTKHNRDAHVQTVVSFVTERCTS